MKMSSIKSRLRSRRERAQGEQAGRKVVWRRVARHGGRAGLYSLSTVGLLSVLGVAVLWAAPAWRASLASQVAPLLDAASGRVAAALPMPGQNDTSNHLMIQASQHVPSAAVLAAYIPAQRIAADAKAERVLSGREQALVADYLARRYRVANDVTANLVSAAYSTGKETGLDPLLLLSVMAIESGFNPYAESTVGAQGLMQVMAKVHQDKLDYFGGPQAALHPLANIKVGALILRECIARGGSLAAGLRLYVGSTSAGDGGYGAKVLAERNRLRRVVAGQKVSPFEPQSPVMMTVKLRTPIKTVKSVDKSASKPVDSASTNATTPAPMGADGTSATGDAA